MDSELDHFHPGGRTFYKQVDVDTMSTDNDSV